MTLRTQYDELPHISAQFRIFIFKVLMRTGSNYFLGFIRIQHFNIHHRLHLEQELISCSFAGSPVQLSSVPVLQRERLHDSKFVQMLLLFFCSIIKTTCTTYKIVLQVVFLGRISAIVGTIKFSDISYFFYSVSSLTCYFTSG
jgi:hypothetical protein